MEKLATGGSSTEPCKRLFHWFVKNVFLNFLYSIVLVLSRHMLFTYYNSNICFLVSLYTVSRTKSKIVEFRPNNAWQWTTKVCMADFSAVARSYPGQNMSWPFLTVLARVLSNRGRGWGCFKSDLLASITTDDDDTCLLFLYLVLCITSGLDNYKKILWNITAETRCPLHLL